MMAENPYVARLQELAPVIEEALAAEFPQPDSISPNLRPLDPFAAYLVLVSKLGALFPALAACCVVLLVGTYGEAAQFVVLILAAVSCVAVAGVSRMEAIAGLWKWPRRGEANSISALRFMGLHFYPARLSVAA
jgi:hypothetical protein